MDLESDYHQHKLKLRELLAKELDAFDSVIKDGVDWFI